MTRAKRGNDNTACTAASLLLIKAGRGSEEEAGKGIKRKGKVLGTH